MSIIRDKAVQTSIVSAAILATTASLGANRYPIPFLALGIIWAGLTAVAVVNAIRKERA